MNNKFNYPILLFFLIVNIIHAQWNQTKISDGAFVSCFAFSDTNIFVGTKNAAGGDVFRSIDNGTNWTNVRPGNIAIYSLIFSSANLFAATPNGVYHSTDNGLSWIFPTKTFEASALAVSDTNLFAGSYNEGVFLSRNNGMSWNAVNSGLNPHVYSLAVLDTNLLAGVIGSLPPWGVFLSTTNGAQWSDTWTEVNEGMGYPVYSLAIANNNIFAGTENGGVFISANNGTSWNAANNGLIERDLYYLASYKQYIFAGSSEYGYGVFVSTDNGYSWTNVGLTQTHISSLAVNDKYLFAGTESGIIWKRPLSDMIPTSVENIENNVPTMFSLEQNYPNPYNPTTTIKYSVPRSCFVTIKIYDLLGKEISSIINENKSAGNYSVQYTAGKLANGVYFYRMHAGDFNETKKMLLIK